MCPTMSHLNALQPKLDEDLILIQTLSGEYIEICADEDDGGYEGTRKNQERKKNKPEKTKKKEPNTSKHPHEIVIQLGMDLKMIGGTLEVRSDKSLTLLTFDI